ncbi:MAG: hypothetical protein LCH95_07870 [Proteobacteria bacterium]|nr:hypothetical protein [Pseudomonadota bacterium]
MKLGYTEFSFGYAFTENLIRSSSHAPVGAPIFPNLLQEGSLGFDVKINFPSQPVFFQYKLPELMVRGTAAEIAHHSLQGISVPFFRMPLMRRDLSSQHELLIDLESQYPDSVFYASPALPNVGAFDAAYANGEVHLRSALFSPRDIGFLPDDKQHVVAYCPWASAWFCSEPKRLTMISFEVARDQIQSLLRAPKQRPMEETVGALGQAIMERVTPELRESEEGIRTRVRQQVSKLDEAPLVGLSDKGTTRSGRERKVAEDILVYREMARVGLGVDLAIAQLR